jgi:hypothetical protein
MRIIEIEALGNGAHRNQTGTFKTIPEGWAMIPDNMETENFPFGEIEVNEIDGIMTVTKWVAGTRPEAKPIPEDEEITAKDILNALTGGVK